MKKKDFIYYASFVGVLFFISWAGFDNYCLRTAPTFPDEMSGRIYPRNYHGTIVYLDQTEQILLYALPAAGFVTIFILAAIDRTFKDEK